MLGIQDNIAENSKICMEIQSQLILPNWIYSSQQSFAAFLNDCRLPYAFCNFCVVGLQKMHGRTQVTEKQQRTAIHSRFSV